MMRQSNAASQPYSDGKTSDTVGSPAQKSTDTLLPTCQGVSSVEVQQTPAGIDSIKYYVNYGTQKVLLSASGNLASTATATKFDAPSAGSFLAGLSVDQRDTSNGTVEMVRPPYILLHLCAVASCSQIVVPAYAYLIAYTTHDLRLVCRNAQEHQQQGGSCMLLTCISNSPLYCTVISCR
jgi:hypothetical protein